jgi:carboxyl-terminal processing protease
LRVRGAIAYGVSLLVVLAVGLWLGGHPAQLPQFLRDHLVNESASLSAEASELIEDNYFRPVGGTELGNASLQGMVRELRKRHDDRFTEYFSPESLESFNQAIEGRFSGVGLSVVTVKRGLRAVQVFHGSPAARAGIDVGDTIVAVDGESIAGQSSTEATNKIKGPEGTEVTLDVLDAKTGKVRQLRLTRAEVALPNVSSKVEQVNGAKLGYVRMLSFSEGVHELLANAVRKVEREGAKGVVLDLRGNPGGLLDEAVLSASVFLPEGEVVVSTESRTQGDSVHKTVGDNLPSRPLVVLIDRNTASAAEILAAALADNAGAPVVGTRSFGKGVFQQEERLANGGALKLTVGEYFTPDGSNLAETKGIHPDVKASDDPQTQADEGKQRALGVLAGRVEG